MMRKTKRILAVSYSQSGQANRLLESVIEPLRGIPGYEVVHECIEPEVPYPFPWPFLRFLDVFPESVYLDPPPLRRMAVDPTEHFDLIILAYQVWFLSPSLPITAFLKSAAGRRLLAGKPVITLIGCRNMWLMAQEKVKGLLSAVGARLLDNVVLVDAAPPLVTFVTTPRWLLTGNRGRPGGLLPPAGIADQDIAAARRFGVAIAAALHDDREVGEGPLLAGLGACRVDERMIASEHIGHRSFRLWGRLLRAVGPAGSARRKPVLLLYALFLVAMILTVVPITLLLRRLAYPLLRPSLLRLKTYYEQPSGADEHLRETAP
jgi:hypothetical protein